MQGLRVGSPVEVFGIQAGNVSALDIDNERQVAVVGMSIRKTVRKMYDATATASKTMGLIGDTYVRIDPGEAGSPLKSEEYIVNTILLPTSISCSGSISSGGRGVPEGEVRGRRRLRKGMSIASIYLAVRRFRRCEAGLPGRDARPVGAGTKEGR